MQKLEFDFEPFCSAPDHTRVLKVYQHISGVWLVDVCPVCLEDAERSGYERALREHGLDNANYQECE